MTINSIKQYTHYFNFKIIYECIYNIVYTFKILISVFGILSLSFLCPSEFIFVLVALSSALPVPNYTHLLKPSVPGNAALSPSYQPGGFICL